MKKTIIMLSFLMFAGCLFTQGAPLLRRTPIQEGFLVTDMNGNGKSITNLLSLSIGPTIINAQYLNSLGSHLGDNVSHVTAGEKSTWNAKVSQSELENALLILQNGNANSLSGEGVFGFGDYTGVIMLNGILTKCSFSSRVVNDEHIVITNVLYHYINSSQVVFTNTTFKSSVGGLILDIAQGWVGGNNYGFSWGNGGMWGNITLDRMGTALEETSVITLGISDLRYAPIGHSQDGDIHVTAEDKTAWNNKVTVEDDPIAGPLLSLHVSDDNIHITSSDKDNWNNAVVGLGTLSGDLAGHTGNSDIHVNVEEKATWSAKVGSATITTIWTGTQAAYDAIGAGNYDATTLYFIQE